MAISTSNERLRSLIDHVIEDGIITHAEYDRITHIVNEDGHIDNQEKALLSQLQEMIENKTIRFKG